MNTPALHIDQPSPVSQVFDYGMANKVLQECQQYRQGVVESVSISRHEVPKPMGLNIMQLLKTGSSSLGLSPAKALQAAESLYQAGYISYPRTESTKYADNFNFMVVISSPMNQHSQCFIVLFSCGPMKLCET